MNEQKNLLLAIVVSLIILLIFQYLFPNEKKVTDSNNQNTINEVEEFQTTTSVSRTDAIKNEQRIYFSEESRLKGSIPLKGLRFDDIILKDYNESIKED